MTLHNLLSLLLLCASQLSRSLVRITEFDKLATLSKLCISCWTYWLLAQWEHIAWKCLEALSFSWHHSGMTVAYVYKSFRRLPCHFWSGARRRASKCIMKKSKRHLTSTVMDVWWLWLNPPRSNMRFQRVIHRWTFLLISKQPQDTLNLVHMTKTQQETALLFWLRYFLFFASCCCCFCTGRTCGLFCISLNWIRVGKEWSF